MQPLVEQAATYFEEAAFHTLNVTFLVLVFDLCHDAVLTEIKHRDHPRYLGLHLVRLDGSLRSIPSSHGSH